ncbi:MAG: hypothetical protein M5U33_07510 [Pseudorhodoplanes sp.]|nr:hypothetical protein [Pseudorhodoplanes sp.]
MSGRTNVAGTEPRASVSSSVASARHSDDWTASMAVRVPIRICTPRTAFEAGASVRPARAAPRLGIGEPVFAGRPAGNGKIEVADLLALDGQRMPACQRRRAVALAEQPSAVAARNDARGSAGHRRRARVGRGDRHRFGAIPDIEPHAPQFGGRERAHRLPGRNAQRNVDQVGAAAHLVRVLNELADIALDE